MLYFLYMSTTISNTLFHHTLTNGTIEYVNKYPFVVKENFILESSINNNFTEQQNISLLEAQKYILKYTHFIGFTFDASHNVSNIQDISRGTVGNAYFYKTNSTITTATNRSVYLIKNNGMSESQYVENDNDYYFGDLDYVKFTIPNTDISNIQQTLTDLSSNISLMVNYKPISMTDVSSISVQSVGNEEYYVDYYLYVWEDINGPWFNGSSLSMTPNRSQLIDNSGNLRDITFNDISNQTQINNANMDPRNLYTYNYFETTASDTSSNYIKVFKLGGTYGTNNGMPEQSSIIIPSPKYTKYNFLWTYSIKNSYKLIFNYTNNTTIEYLLEGYSPFFTPAINISGINWNYNFFSNMGSSISHYTSLNVERIYKAIHPIELNYNTQVITLSIPEQDQYDISENFVKRYQSENRNGTTFLIDPIDRTKYIHLYEDKEITRLTYNIYFFINQEIQYGITLTNQPIDLSNNTLTQNNTVYPYGDNFTDISYNQLFELSDNLVYINPVVQSNVDYGDVPYNGVNSEDVSRNRYNGEDDVDGTPAQVNAATSISNDTIDKYFAYENNTSLNIEILRIRKQDLLNLPNYGHLVSSNDWNVYYKKYNIKPTTTELSYTMTSNKYFLRWNYNVVRYSYNKNFPIDYKQSYFTKSSLNSGISNLQVFDFTEFDERVYPNSLLDLSYTSLPHYTNNQIDYYYKNLHITIPENTLNRLSTNIFYNHNENARVQINIFILKPDNISGQDQQNNYDTRDIDYDLFDLSFSFYDSNRIVPLHEDIFIDISENGRDDTLLAGQYTIEWNYEIIVDGGVPVTYLPFDKSSSSGVYTVNSTVIDISYNDFLYDLSGLHVYSNANFTNLFLEFAQEDIERFVDYINIYHKTLDISNTTIEFNFNLFTPNKEESQTNGFFWSLPPGYQGREDPRLYQAPVTYLNKTIIPSPTIVYDYSNLYGDIGFDLRYVSYVNSVNEFYNLTSVYDISSSTNVNLGADISNSLTDINNYIVEMIIPDGQTNHTDVSANFGVGSIENFNVLQATDDTTNGVHLGLLTDNSNNTIVYFKNGTAYTIDTVSGESFKGKIRWLMESSGNNISVTVSVNNKKGVYIETGGVPASTLTFLGSGATDMSQNNSTIKIYNKRDNSENIIMTDISRTDIIFHQIKDPTAIGGNETIPQSNNHTNATFQIPYICKMDYRIHDRTNNFKFDSIIRKRSKGLNNVYHRIEDWDVSYNTTNGTTNYFFNVSAENPFTHKNIYGVGFISPIDYDVVNFYYPGKLNLEYNQNRRTLTLEITDKELLYLKFNLVDLWNAVNDNTAVQFRYYGWQPKSGKINNLISSGLDPATATDISNVVTELSGVDFTAQNVDFMYDINSNAYYEFNYPKIPKTVFIIDENDLRSGIYYIGWTYIINNTWNVNKIPPTRDYDLSLATIIIPTFQYKPTQPILEFKTDVSQVIVSIQEQNLLDMSRNIYYKNYNYQDISEVKINYYLWSPNNINREDNSGGWILPNDYKGVDDIRIKQFPSIYYDETNKINKFYDISYNGGYGLDKTKAIVKTLSGKNLNDISKAVFTLADLSLNSMAYSSRYSKNQHPVPYICIWNYELVMATSSSDYGVSIQSDISNSSDISYNFRLPDWKLKYELVFNKNKTNLDVNLNTNDFYNYSSSSISDDATNNIRKFVKVKLDFVAGQGLPTYEKLDNSGNNILLNTIQINETSYNNNTIYLYNLYSNQGVQSDTEIPSNNIGGNWTFNTQTGRIVFQNQPQLPIIVNESNPVYFTFYKKIGTDSIQNIFKQSNATFETNIFNRYNYTAGLLIEPVVPPEPKVVFNSYRCTAEGCIKETTKTQETKNFIMRYASLFDIDFRLASKISFDCNTR